MCSDLVKRLLVISFLLILSACTRPQNNEVGKRVEKSLSGDLTAPSDIDPSGTNSFSFAVFGDTHVGSPFGNVLNEAVVNSKAAGDSFIVVAGDLTDSALNESFDEFIEVFSDNSMTYRAAIGNHDIYFDGWDRYQNKIGPGTYSFDADNVHFSFLDSANGVIGRRQLNWLESDLKATSQPIKVIVTHFSPYTGELQSIWRLSSEEETAILKDMAYRYDVNLVIAGHYHGYVNKVIGGTRYITTGGVNKLIDFGNHKHYIRVTVNGTDVNVEKVSF